MGNYQLAEVDRGGAETLVVLKELLNSSFKGLKQHAAGNSIKQQRRLHGVLTEMALKG